MQPHTTALCTYVCKDVLIQSGFWVHCFSKTKEITRKTGKIKKQPSLSCDPTSRPKDTIPKGLLLKGESHPVIKTWRTKGITTDS